jgi:uncharacterized protein (TIGR02271 family)
MRRLGAGVRNLLPRRRVAAVIGNRRIMANSTNETTLPGAAGSDPLGTDRDEAFRLDRSPLSGADSLSGALAVGEVSDTEVIPLVEETVRIGKREVRGGAVRIRTVVDTVEEMSRAELQGERVEVTRVPIDREITAAPQIRTENGVTIIPVVEEVLVVEKRLVLKEELHVRREQTTETVEVPVTVRKQRAVVERVSPDGDTRAEEID